MITEKSFAKVFEEFWSETFPLLTPSFVRVFNEAYCERLTDLPSSKFSAIPISKGVEKHDLVAEFAFCAAESVHESGKSLASASKSNAWLNSVYERALQFLKKYDTGETVFLLNRKETREALIMAKQYQLLFDYLELQPADVTFRPLIKGAGFLGYCTADLAANDTLYEIKAVSRNVLGKDIRQLLVYLALSTAEGPSKWDHAGFFNPRRALYYRFSVDHLVYRTSGGRSTVEVFDSLIDFLDNRNIELDTPF